MVSNFSTLSPAVLHGLTDGNRYSIRVGAVWGSAENIGVSATTEVTFRMQNAVHVAPGESLNLIAAQATAVSHAVSLTLERDKQYNVTAPIMVPSGCTMRISAQEAPLRRRKRRMLSIPSWGRPILYGREQHQLIRSIGGDLSLQGIALTGGHGRHGGAVEALSGSLAINGCVIEGNVA